MSDQSYEALRQLADSWGLLAMACVFLFLVLWPLRPGTRGHYQDAANSIFEEGQDDVQ